MATKTKAEIIADIASTLATNTTKAITAAIMRARFTDLIDSLAFSTDLAGKSDTGHTHGISGVTGLQAALDAKADSSATASALADKADASAVATALSGKSDYSHTHSNATTGAAGFMSAADKTKLDGINTLSSTSVAYAATITPAVSADRNELRVGTLTGNVTFANPTGTPRDGMVLCITYTEDATGGRTISLGNKYVGTDQNTLASLPTTANKKVGAAFKYNAADDLWVLVAVVTR